MATHYTPISTAAGVANTAPVVNQRLQQLDDAIVGLETGVSPFQQISVGTPVALTLSANVSGAITITNTSHTVDTFAAAASGDLARINGGINGDLLMLSVANNARPVTVKTGADNIVNPIGADYVMNDINKVIILRYNGTNWVLVSIPQLTLVSAETTEYLSGTPATGRSVLVAATASPGTLVHTAHATFQDSLFIYAHNSDTTIRTLTLQFGGTTTPNDDIKIDLGAEQGSILIIPGIPLTGGVILRAWASSANVITINGIVKRNTLLYAGLSGSPGSGRNILVVPTATPGTLIHTAHATLKDKIWLYAYNSHTVAVKLTIEFGGMSAPTDLVEVTVPKGAGLFFVVPGYLLSNSLVVRAFAAVANVVTISGYVERGV